jgi:cation diffusion facilitator family transporter
MKKGGGVWRQVGGVSGAWRRVSGSRHLATLLAFASVYTLVASGIFAYGVYCDSLALMADACAQLFACAALAIRVASSVVETAPATPHYAYGLRRLEVLLSFCAGASAVFVALFLIGEALEHLLHADSHVSGAHLMTAAVLGLAVKLVGALFFYEYMRTRSETTQPFEQAGDQWRHLVVDAVCSICVIFNSWLVTWRNAMLADAVVAFLLAALLIGAAVPVCLRAGFVLLHTTPAVRRDDLAAATRDAHLLPGVVECRAAHFWTLAPGVFAGSVGTSLALFHHRYRYASHALSTYIVVRVRAGSSHSQILSSVRDLFSPIVQHLTVSIDTQS